MKRNHKIIVGAGSVLLFFGAMVSADIIYINTTKGTQTITNYTSAAPVNEAKTVVQDKDGDITLK